MTTAATRTVTAATAASRFARTISVALAAEFLLERRAAFRAVGIFPVGLNKFFAFIPAFGAHKFN